MTYSGKAFYNHINDDCQINDEFYSLEAGNKCVEKICPDEAVGVVCKLEGKIQVVEYSEIAKDTAELRNKEGKLTYSAGNICNHFFTRDFLKVGL